MTTGNVIEADVVDERTGEVLPARQMRGEVLRPEDVQISTQQALAVATELKEVVRQQKWVSRIQGNDYLNVEAWMFIGGKFGISASTEIDFVKHEGETVAVLARAKLIDRRTGDVIAEAAQTCDLGGKFKELNHAVGMAQTRAISRAYQQQFRWIAKLAGYEGTPAEEMEGVEPRARKRESPPPAAPVKAADAPTGEPAWFDEALGFGKHRDKTWRVMCEGEYGNPKGRYGYLQWLSEAANDKDKQERAHACLAIYEVRRDAQDTEALAHEDPAADEAFE